MRLCFKHITLFILLFFKLNSYAQTKQKTISNAVPGDTLITANLPIIPSSIKTVPASDSANFNYTLTNNNKSILAEDSISKVTFKYSLYPIEFNKDYYHKDTTLIQEENILESNPNLYLVNKPQNEPVFFEGLNKSGSLSRGITVGNNQDAVLNSNLNLQLSGNINPNTTIKASITDNQIPVYAEGISQSLQEFDRVFIEVENTQFGKIQAGDFDIGPSGHYFLNFKKRISGAGVQSPIRLNKGTLYLTGVGALARGEFHRNTFRGTEGNQGPYKLNGKNNELVILVISGSERVYIDGKLQKRGLEQDYTIDYTTGEVTFTAFRPITKDSRIVVEFQYTVQNYLRSIGYGGANYVSENWQHSVFIYSEQDSKNQPISPLNSEEKEILFNAGNDPLQAVSPAWQEANYDANRILYELKDTLGNDSVFVFSTNNTAKLFEVFFSFVGTNQGDYIALETAANGRVYSYVAPIGGVPQGTHIPFTILPRPEKIQLVSYLGAWKNEKNKIGWEIAHSNKDPNRFSSIDNEENTGIAAKLNYQANWKKNDWIYNAGVNSEMNTKNFSTVERIRNVEFLRDWNLQNTPSGDLYLAGVNFEANQSNQVNLKLKSNFIDVGNNYNGIKTDGFVSINKNGWLVHSVAAYLNTQDTGRQTSFFRQETKVAKYLDNKQYVGVSTLSENNTTSNGNLIEDIFNYKFLQYYAFTGYGDTAKSFIEAGYFSRTDDTIRNESWSRAALANGGILKGALRSAKAGNLLLKVQYRELENFDDQEILKSITTRIQYNKRFWKNFLGWNSFYETGMGREPRRDYKYLKVPKGTGTHVWIDYNNNGIEEINEFEPAPFVDLADYIRIFVITRDYLPVSNIKFTQQLDFNFKQLNAFRKDDNFIGRFNIQSYYLLNRKELLTDNTNTLNPFKNNIADSLLIQQIENFRTTLFYNRANPKYGADYTFQQNTSRNLLSYGLENVLTKEHSINFRYLIKKKVELRAQNSWSDKQNTVPDFATRNYLLYGQLFKATVSYQSGKYLRLSADYSIDNQKNEGEGGERLYANKLGGEFNLNHPKWAAALARFEWVDNNFNGNAFSPVGFEMLKGLQPGTNYLWFFSLQKNITSFLQLSLNYNGRKSENNPTIHTGTVEVKAFF